MTITLKPAKDAAFYESIAELNPAMLVNAATTAAIRKDFDSLNGLVDFLMQRGSEVPVFVGNVELTACVPRSATDTSTPGVERKEQSIGLAFAIAMGTFDPENRKYEVATPPEAIALAQRVGDLYNKPHANDELKRQLDVVLHLAAGQVNDGRVVKILVDAGANAGTKTKSQRDGINTLTLPFVEALLQHNLKIAAELINVTPPDAFKAWVESTIKPKPKGGATTPVYLFSVGLGIDALVNGLRFRSERVDQVLKAIDRTMEAAGRPMEASRFRIFLATAYLGKVGDRKTEAFGEKQVLALFGAPGDAVNAGLKTLLDAFANRKNPNTGKNPELDLWRSANTYKARATFNSIEGDFLYHAARTHCHEALDISKEVMVAAQRNQGPGLWHALNGCMPTDSGQTSQWSFDPARFQKTLTVLTAAGEDPNALFGGSNALHALAGSKSKDVIAMLPAVLALVDRTDAKDVAGQTPIDVLRKSRTGDPETVARWDSVCKSHAARTSALSLIDEIERDEKKVAP